MDPMGMEKLREAASKRMGGLRRGPGPGGSKRPTMPHEDGDAGEGKPTFSPPNGFDGMGNLPEGLGMPASKTPPPAIDPPLTSRDFAVAAGPSLIIYAILTFIPTMAIFQLIYNYFFQESYFGGMNFYKLLYYSLTGQLAKRMGVEDAAAMAETLKTQQANSKIPLGKNGKPLTPSEEYANIAAKAKLVSAILRSRRHEYHGLVDDDYLRQCVAEATSIATGGKVGSKKGAQPQEINGKTRVKVSSGMLAFLEEEEAALRSNPTSDPEVKCENLAIFIGVNTDETPLALEDAEKLCNRVFKDPQRPTGPNGTYRTCFFGCQGRSTTAGNDTSVDAHQRVFVKPTSANLMALIADIATCRVRQWNNIVVYVAAPLRAAPTGWLDDSLVRDESTNYIHRENFLRSDLVTTIEDKDSYFVKNCFTDTSDPKKKKTSAPTEAQPPFPRFTLEFLGDAEDPSCELSWVDLNLFLTRLREAVLESARLQEVASMCAKGLVAEASNVSAARFRTTGTSVVLMLDAAYRPEAVYESVDFITNTREGFYCDPTVGMSETDRKNRAASESKLTSAQQESLRLTIDVNEKPLFAPPPQLLKTLAALSLHEAVAYGMIATLTPFTNFTVFAAPRRNYFVEKAVRQSLQKAAWSLEEGGRRDVPIKTPSAALAALMVSSNSAAKPVNVFSGVSVPSLTPSANNPRLVGFSDFTRCFMEGYFSAMAADGKVPTADVALDKLNDPTAALMAPGIRGSVENSAFWCGRMTVASTALYLARHPQMMGFSDIILPAADGSVVAPLSSGMSMASTASPGSKVPTTNTPLLGFFSRGVLNDATLFSQMSLAPRGAPSSVCPPLLTMPSQKHLRHCEEVLLPAIRISTDSIFHRVIPEGDAPCLGSCDLAPVLQAIGWNGDLLRHFTDGIHFFSVPTLVPCPTDSVIASATKGLSLTPERYIDLLAQHFIMRLASSLLEHSGHSHFGTVPTFSEAIRVLTVFREQAVMAIIFLNAPTEIHTDTERTNLSVWMRSLEYLHDVFKDVPARSNGEARLSIIFVPSPSLKNSTSLALPKCLLDEINTVALPPPSSLDSKTAFRSKWVLPFATGAASDYEQLHTMYSNTFADTWPYVVADDSYQSPLELEKKEAIAKIVGALTRGNGHASSTSRVAMIEEIAKSVLPSSLPLSSGEKDQTACATAALYESLPEGYIAPLLRYLVLSHGHLDTQLSSLSSTSAIVREVMEAILKPTPVARRVAPTVDVASIKMLLEAIYRAVAMGGVAPASVFTARSTALDGIVRIPTSVVFGVFDELLNDSGSGLIASGQRLQFARVWTLFHDGLALLGFSGLFTSGSSANGAVVSQPDERH